MFEITCLCDFEITCLCDYMGFTNPHALNLSYTKVSTFFVDIRRTK